MSPEARVGLDVGGTRIKAGRIRSDGEVLEERSVPTAADSEGLASQLAQLARELDFGGAPIGVGLPGLLDRARGVITNSPNIAQLEGLDLGRALGSALGIDAADVQLENDANAAALGEDWLGAGRDLDSTLTVTLGTGIGGGLVLAGQLYRGDGQAGEVGHVRVRPDGPPCGCGGRGCAETLASATATRRRAVERGLPAEDPGNLELLNERATDRSSPEAALLHEIGFDLGIALSAVVNLLDLRHFVIGGGFSAALPALEPGIRAGIREGAYGDRVDAISIRRATLGGSAGWIGAARLAHGEALFPPAP